MVIHLKIVYQMGKFKELRVWVDSMQLAENIYAATKSHPFSQDFALRNQIVRAVISISSNIAEGDERGTNRGAVYFFNVSKGSTAEVISQLNLAYRLGYLDLETMTNLENLAEKIRASLKNLIRARGGSNPIKVLLWLLITILKPI
jgi:four helix bundle protein